MEAPSDAFGRAPNKVRGIGLLVMAGVTAFAYENTGKSSHFRMKDLSQEFDSKSDPELFEARNEAFARTGIIALSPGSRR